MYKQKALSVLLLEFICHVAMIRHFVQNEELGVHPQSFIPEAVRKLEAAIAGLDEAYEKKRGQVPKGGIGG